MGLSLAMGLCESHSHRSMAQLRPMAMAKLRPMAMAIGKKGPVVMDLVFGTH